MSIDVEVKITNKKYADSYKDKESKEYKDLEKEFKKQVTSGSPSIISYSFLSLYPLPLNGFCLVNEHIMYFSFPSRWALSIRMFLDTKVWRS